MIKLKQPNLPRHKKTQGPFGALYIHISYHCIKKTYGPWNQKFIQYINDISFTISENESPASNGGRKSFADVYKKKYGSRKSSSSYSSTEATPPTASTEKVTYPPRPTPTLRYNRFVPTAKSFKPMFKRVRTTTFSTSPQPTTTTTTGQLNSDWIYEVIVSPKMQTKNYKDFCPTKQTRIVAKKLCTLTKKSPEKSATILVCMVGQKCL